MCKHHLKHAQDRERHTAYEGETVQLDSRQGVLAAQHAPARCGHFPWWILWFIWPLIGLVKLLAVSVPSLFAATVAFLQRPIFLEVSLLPIVLIIIGVFLLLSGRSRE